MSRCERNKWCKWRHNNTCTKDCDDFELSAELVYTEDTHTADVQEIKHGKWIEQPVSFDLCGIKSYRCSLCNSENDYRSRFCPHCGTKMDLEEKENEQTHKA